MAVKEYYREFEEEINSLPERHPDRVGYYEWIDGPQECFDGVKPGSDKSRERRRNNAAYDIDKLARRHAKEIFISFSGKEDGSTLKDVLEEFFANTPKLLQNELYVKYLSEYLKYPIRFSEFGRKPIEKKQPLSPEDYIVTSGDNLSVEADYIAEEIGYCYTRR